MKNIFENAYFGKPYKTRDGRKALFCRKDGDTFDLETEDSYNPVRANGSFLYYKEGCESSCDIVSEWHTEIDEEELDELADRYASAVAECEQHGEYIDDADIFKAGYCKAMEKINK